MAKLKTDAAFQEVIQEEKAGHDQASARRRAVVGLLKSAFPGVMLTTKWNEDGYMMTVEHSDSMPVFTDNILREIIASHLNLNDKKQLSNFVEATTLRSLEAKEKAVQSVGANSGQALQSDTPDQFNARFDQIRRTLKMVKENAALLGVTDFKRIDQKMQEIDERRAEKGRELLAAPEKTAPELYIESTDPKIARQVQNKTVVELLKMALGTIDHIAPEWGHDKDSNKLQFRTSHEIPKSLGKLMVKTSENGMEIDFSKEGVLEEFVHTAADLVIAAGKEKLKFYCENPTSCKDVSLTNISWNLQNIEDKLDRIGLATKILLDEPPASASKLLRNDVNTARERLADSFFAVDPAQRGKPVDMSARRRG